MAKVFYILETINPSAVDPLKYYYGMKHLCRGVWRSCNVSSCVIMYIGKFPASPFIHKSLSARNAEAGTEALFNRAGS